MATHACPEHVHLRDLLRRLEATQNSAAAPPVDARAPHVDGWLDWIRGPGFGTVWYTDLALRCRTLASLSARTAFKNQIDDFHTNLKAFLDLCAQASLDTHARTEPLETQVLRLWTPLAPQLRAYQTRLNGIAQQNPKNVSLLAHEQASVDAILSGMTPFVSHFTGQDAS